MKGNMNGSQIAIKVRDIIDDYYIHPKEKERIIEELKEFFSSEHPEMWCQVLTLNSFREGFKRKLGVKRLKTLLDLLLEIDYDHYIDVDFK